MPKFTRGSGPLVSILIPSRGNPTGLSTAIQSLLHFAKDRSQIEILVKIDDDDTKTLDWCQDLKRKFPFEAYVGPRGRGYLDIPQYLNLLASKARGDWLFIFCDDVVMATPWWDEILLNADNTLWTGIDDVAYFQVLTTTTNFPEFFILRRKVFEILGGLGRHVSIDSWQMHLHSILMTSRILPIYVLHGKKDNPGVIPERLGGDDYESVKSIRDRVVDLNKLLDYLEANGKTRSA